MNMTEITAGAEACREGWRISLTAKGTVCALVLAQARLIPDCGQPPPEGKDEPTAEGMEERTSAEDSELQGMVDSYAVAHEEIEEEGGEKETGPYRVSYIVELVEGWWEGDPEDPEWRAPSPNETHHLEILPFDRESGLLIPEMEGRLTVVEVAGEGDNQPVSCTTPSSTTTPTTSAYRRTAPTRSRPSCNRRTSSGMGTKTAGAAFLPRPSR